MPHRATPAVLYDTMPKAVPGEVTDPQTHDRIRHDVVDKAGSVRCATAAGCTTSASGEPTPDPASSCSSRTCTSGSYTQPPENSSANSPSTPNATTSPPEPPTDPPASPRNEQQPDLQLQVQLSPMS